MRLYSTVKIVALLLAMLAILPDARAQETVPTVSLSPEAATGASRKDLAVAKKFMVAAAHPAAVNAGVEILREGGSAVDAAIAVQMVLGLVEPQSSGIGGGAFLVHWNSKARAVETYDARESAPAAARPDRFLRDGVAMPFGDAIRSGLSVGVPGVVSGLALAHKEHGKLQWARLFEPAITLATNGFPVSRRLNMLLQWQGAQFFSDGARDYFFDKTGKPWAVGSLLKNPQYAATLRKIATAGEDGFYRGDVAASIVNAVAHAPIAAGDITPTDLADYRAKPRDALCFAYRLRRICGMGPPSSGALTIAQTLQLIEPMASVAGPLSRMSSSAIHAIAEAEKLAYADRNRYIADPDFVALPSGYLDAAYLAERRRLIDPARAMTPPSAGVPPGVAKRAFGVDATVESAGTSHISIVDQDGNAIAMTTTIESAFGSGLWAEGFLLNNELTDFSFQPTDADGTAIANAVAGGKRPRSSMAPTLVFGENGALEIVTGSPGGSRIILFVIKALVAMIDWQMDAQSAADLVNFGSEGGAFQIENGVYGPGLSGLWPALRMKGYGHDVTARMMTSGIHTIQVRNGRLEGGADPRREGVARGE